MILPALFMVHPALKALKLSAIKLLTMPHNTNHACCAQRDMTRQLRKERVMRLQQPVCSWL